MGEEAQEQDLYNIICKFVEHVLSAYKDPTELPYNFKIELTAELKLISGHSRIEGRLSLQSVLTNFLKYTEFEKEFIHQTELYKALRKIFAVAYSSNNKENSISWINEECCPYHKGRRANIFGEIEEKKKSSNNDTNKNMEDRYKLFEGLIELACLEVDKETFQNAKHMKGKDSNLFKSGMGTNPVNVTVHRFIELECFVKDYFPSYTPEVYDDSNTLSPFGKSLRDICDRKFYKETRQHKLLNFAWGPPRGHLGAKSSDPACTRHCKDKTAYAVMNGSIKEQGYYKSDPNIDILLKTLGVPSDSNDNYIEVIYTVDIYNEEIVDGARLPTLLDAGAYEFWLDSGDEFGYTQNLNPGAGPASGLFEIVHAPKEISLTEMDFIYWGAVRE